MNTTYVSSQLSNKANLALWNAIEVYMRANTAPDKIVTVSAMMRDPGISRAMRQPTKSCELSSVMQQLLKKKIVLRVGSLGYYWNFALTDPSPIDYSNNSEPVIPASLRKDSELNTVVMEKVTLDPQIKDILDGKQVTHDPVIHVPAVVKSRHVHIVDNGVDVTLTLGAGAKIIIKEV